MAAARTIPCSRPKTTRVLHAIILRRRPSPARTPITATMKRIFFTIAVLGGRLAVAAPESQFAPIFEQAQAGRSIDDALTRIDVGKIDFAQETPSSKGC